VALDSGAEDSAPSVVALVTASRDKWIGKDEEESIWSLTLGNYHGISLERLRKTTNISVV
jgi:hypothetical protein